MKQFLILLLISCCAIKQNCIAMHEESIKNLHDKIVAMEQQKNEVQQELQNAVHTWIAKRIQLSTQMKYFCKRNDPEIKLNWYVQFQQLLGQVRLIKPMCSKYLNREVKKIFNNFVRDLENDQQRYEQYLKNMESETNSNSQASGAE